MKTNPFAQIRNLRVYKHKNLNQIISFLVIVFVGVAQDAVAKNESKLIELPVVSSSLAPAKSLTSTKIQRDLVNLYSEFQAFHRHPINEGFTSAMNSLSIANDYITIDAVAIENAQELRTDLESLGMKNIAGFRSTVSGQFPISRIMEMNTLTSLKFARPAYSFNNAGLTTSQGDISMLSDIARTQFGVDGTGVKVGTLSDSFNCKNGEANDVANADLPSGIIVLKEESGCTFGKDEGRAMMQIIHDVAPGADQLFYTASGGEAAFALGIIELQKQGADVIVDDVSYPTEPMFQDGLIAIAADTVSSLGTAYFSSAGNFADNAYDSVFVASGNLLTIGGNPAGIAHDFDPSPDVDIFQNISVPEGSRLRISFQWDSPFFKVSGLPGSPNDLDIYLLNSINSVVLASSIDNNQGNDPVEILQYTNPAGSGSTSFNLLITKKLVGPTPGRMKYVIVNGGTINEFDSQSGTIFGHSNASGVEAVGAARYYQTPEFGQSPALLESFSSIGTTPILFETSGAVTLQERDKPNIVAPDGANTSFFGGTDPESDGFPNFFGTSAAAPHAAAVAALMIQAQPNLTPTEIYTALENTASDMDITGFDSKTGYGFIQADAAISAVLQNTADLSISVTSSPQTVSVGDEITIDITVSNNGNATASDITLVDALPTGSAFSSVNPIQGACVHSEGIVTCDLGNLSALETTAVQIIATALQVGTLTNNPQVTSATTDPNASNNSASASTTVNDAADTDGDGINDSADNCTVIVNSGQIDTDNDNIGNACDPDFNQNGIVDQFDFSQLKACFGSTECPLEDLNSNGVVDQFDFSRLKDMFGQAPGPSALVE